MTTVELLASLHKLNVQLALDGDTLRFSAPPGVMTPDVRAALVERKEEVIQFLRQAQEHTHAAPSQITPVAHDGALPLSYAQEYVWQRMRQLPPGAIANKLMAVRLVGPLDPYALAQSLDALVQRHAVLRTTLKQVDGQPLSLIAPALRVELVQLDLTGSAEPEQTVVLRQMMADELSAPIDEQRGPLLRARLLRLDEQTHALLIAIHPIAWDGWSKGVLVHDLAALYTALGAGQPSTLPPLPIQYVDYALWQRGWLQGAVLQRLLHYWTTQLAGMPGALDLPYDTPRPAVQRFCGAYYGFAIAAELHQAAATLSRQAGVTLHVTLLAAFQLLLQQYSRQDDLVIGLPVTNRTRRETHGLIGLFVNTLVLRTNLAGDPSFYELLKRLHARTADAYAHQELPIGHVIAALQPAPDQRNHLPYRVMFDLADSPLPAQTIAGLTISYLPLDTLTTEIDLWLSLEQSPRGLEATLIYDADLFVPATIRRLAQQYQMILAAAVADPTQRLAELQAAASAEHRPSQRHVLAER
jgi:hypothetical protein